MWGCLFDSGRGEGMTPGGADVASTVRARPPFLFCLPSEGTTIAGKFWHDHQITPKWQRHFFELLHHRQIYGLETLGASIIGLVVSNLTLITC